MTEIKTPMIRGDSEFGVHAIQCGVRCSHDLRLSTSQLMRAPGVDRPQTGVYGEFLLIASQSD